MTNFLRKLFEKKPESKKILLKEVILESNKEEVFEYLLEYIKNNFFDENGNLDGKWLSICMDDYMDYKDSLIYSISDKSRLEKTYDELYHLSQQEFDDEREEKYILVRSDTCFFAQNGAYFEMIPSNIKLVKDENIIRIDNELFSPTIFLVNCALNRYLIECHSISEIVGICLTTVIFSQELRKSTE